MTDANSARRDQIALFHLWQTKNGHVDEHRYDDVDKVQNPTRPAPHSFVFLQKYRAKGIQLGAVKG